MDSLGLKSEEGLGFETQSQKILPSAPAGFRALHRFSLLLALGTLVLLVAGGLVTSHGVGMAVPDWPNTYGYNMFFFPVSQWVGGIFYEHTHRLIASGIGLLTSILAVWLYGYRARPFLRWLGFGLSAVALSTIVLVPLRWADGVVLLIAGLSALASSLFWPRVEPAPKWLRRLGLIAFVSVVLQGTLGGLRVVLFKDEIGILHAALAQLFFVLVCAIALFTSPWWRRTEPAFKRIDFAGCGRVLPWSLTGAILIFLQLVLGATMRHQHAGLAIPDFPLTYGKLWPATDAESVAAYNQRRFEVTESNPITAFQIRLQMAHRLVALAILGCVVGCAVVACRRLGARDLVSKLSMTWAGLIAFQVLLGAATIWSNKAADMATAHMMAGALSLALGSIMCIVLARNSLFARRSASLGGFPEPSSLAVPRPAPANTAN